MNKTIQLQDLGLKYYKETWEYQEELFKGVVDLKIKNRREETNLDPSVSEQAKQTPNYFLFVEHPHVYTLGKSGDLENLLLSEKQLEAKGATVEYNDPHVPVIRPTREHPQFIGKKSVEISNQYDLILISTAHNEYSSIDFAKLSIPVVDTRNVVKTASPLIYKA